MASTLDSEIASCSNIKNKYEVMEKDSKFKIKMLENQLKSEREKSQVDISSMDISLKSEFESR